MYYQANNPMLSNLKIWYEITADIYNNTSETWSDEITRKWFPTLKEARSYYLYHPNKIANRLYSNFKIYRCVKGEDPPPKNGLQRHAGIIQEQVL